MTRSGRALVRAALAGAAGLALAAGAAAQAPAAARLRGTVTDAATGAPVRATVTIAPGGRVARTDSVGRFTFGSLPSGEVTLTTSAVGYRAGADDGAPRAGADTAIALMLTRSCAS